VQLTGLSKILAQEIGPGLRNLTVLPLQLTPERDDALWQLTEGRIPIFSHDLVPDYLRTKSEPSAEAKIVQYESKANSINPEKLVTQYTKVISHVWEMLNKAREDWDLEASARAGIQQSSSQHDTQLLVAAVGMGKGLKQINMPMPGGPGGPMGGPMGGPIRPPSMGAVSPGVGQIGKIPSAIKTNIKSANQIHPYR
jgi:mediator of RNA polymerase II transcription subunit 8